MSEQIPNKKFTLKDAIISGKEWFNYLLSKWLIIVVFGLLGGGIGLTLGFMSKPVYKAGLSFALDDQGGDKRLSGALSLASQFGFDLGSGGGGMFASANLIELFKSRNMIEQTLLLPAATDARISYAEMFIRSQEWRKGWEKKPALKNIQFPPNPDRAKFTRTQDSIMGAIYEIIVKNSLSVIQKDKKVDIINMEMQSLDENFSKYFTEALAQQVCDFYVMTKNKKARMNMEIIQQQTDSIRGLLEGAITDVAVNNDNNFAINPALNNVRRTPSTKRQIDVQYNVAILSELIKQTELARVSLRKETPLIEIIDRPILPLKKEKLGKLTALIIGGFLGGIFIVGILVFRRMYKQMLS